MADEEPEIAFEIVRQSVANYPFPLRNTTRWWFPRGTVILGIMLDYFAEFLAAIDYTFGNDYGLGDLKAYPQQAFYPCICRDPTNL